MAWTIPTAVRPGTFEIEVTGPYRVVVACEPDDLGVFILQYARTPLDRTLITHPCFRDVPAPGAFTVTGSMVQPSGVGFGNHFTSSGTANWSFEVAVAAGSYDLVLLRGDDAAGFAFEQIAIRRDLAIADDTDLGTIDVDQEAAQQLVRTTFTGPNVGPNEVTDTTVLLDAGGTFAILHGASNAMPARWEARLAPDAILQATDRQTLVMSADETIGAVSRNRTFVRDEARAGDSTSFALLEPLGPVTFEMSADVLKATWTTLPDYDSLVLDRSSVSQADPGFITHQTALTRSFVHTTAATTITVELDDVPGFRLAWAHDPANPQDRRLSARRNPSPREFVASSVREEVTPMPAAVAWMRHQRLQRVEVDRRADVGPGR